MDIFVGGGVSRPTMFLVVPSKASYNLLLGREWIHGFGVVPSSLHQKLYFWDEWGDVHVVKADEKYFKKEADVLHFERCYSKMGPFSISKETFKQKKKEATFGLLPKIQIGYSFGFKPTSMTEITDLNEE